jgi:hypothetical protein
MRTLVLSLVVIVLCSSLDAVPAPRKKAGIISPRLPAVAVAALQTISPDRIREHVRFLASDLLEGRGTGQRGGDIAAEYIASQFAQYGLKPAGDNDTYLQKVPMVGVTTMPESTFSLVPANGQPMSLKLLDEVVASDQREPM